MENTLKLRIYASPKAEIVELQLRALIAASPQENKAPNMEEGWSINF